MHAGRVEQLPWARFLLRARSMCVFVWVYVHGYVRGCVVSVQVACVQKQDLSRLCADHVRGHVRGHFWEACAVCTSFGLNGRRFRFRWRVYKCGAPQERLEGGDLLPHEL